MMVCNVHDFDPAQVVRNYVGSRGEDMDCKFYNKIYHFPFITPQTMVKKKINFEFSWIGDTNIQMKYGKVPEI